MSLQFIIGSAGSGKSTYLYNRVIEDAMAHPRDNYLVIVPEQFTMHTQAQLVAMHPKHAIMNIDVLSFDRMAYRIFDELGTDTLEVLEETGKNLLLRKVAQEQEKQLHILGKNMKRPGYIAQVKSLISEFSQYNITPDRLEEILECPQVGEAFRRKGQDLVTIYGAFQQKIAGSYITTEQVLQKFLDVAQDSKILKDATIVFDGFTGFTPIQNQVLSLLMKITRKMVFTITCDVDEDFFGEIAQQDLFAMSKKTMQTLIHMAQRTSTVIQDPVLLSREGRGRFMPEGKLAHMEGNLFRKRPAAYEGTGETKDDIRVISLKNPRQELAYAASEIERAVRTKKMRYSDFAIVCADLNTYRYSVSAVFEEYRVPYFLDVKREIVFHPMIEFIYGILLIFEEDFSYESVMRLLRTGLSDLSIEEADLLENYILAANIRGRRKYQQMFVIQPQGMTVEQLVTINEIRDRFMTPIQQFVADVQEQMQMKEGWLTRSRKVSVYSLSYAVYRYLSYYKIQSRLENKAEEYQQMGDEVRSGQYHQIFTACMELLDKMTSILGTEEVTVTEYREILASGFESVAIGMVPPAKDCVVIGDMERTRLSDIRVLYLLGANDGAIPKTLANGGILSQLDRECLLELGVELAPSDRQRAFLQRFYLYFVMTKPSRELVVTFSRVDKEGKANGRSYLIGMLLGMFPELKVRELEELPLENRTLTKETTEAYFVDLLREYAKEGQENETFLTCLKWSREQEKDRFLELWEAAFFQHKTEQLSKAAVDAVYGENITESVSRMEQYARCAYAYFLRYGLGLLPRQEYAFEISDMGNLYHEALENYSKSLSRQSDVNWYTVTQEQSQALLREAIQSTYQTMKKTQILEGDKEKYLLWRMERTLQQTVETLIAQVRKGSFVPKSFEVDFREVGDLESLRFQLDEMHTMRLRGVIDRVDLCEEEQNVYVKIVDYKSGAKDIDFTKMYHGLQVQLVLYMDATAEGLRKQKQDKNVLPGAMLYYHIDRPVLSADTVKKTTKEDALLKELQMHGVVNGDLHVVEALHHGLEGRSDVVPVAINKDGSLSKNSNAITEEEFDILSRYVRRMMEQTGKRILKGDIACNPYRMGKETGCTYCEYNGICGFDSRMEGYSYRKLPEGMSRQDVLEHMRMDLAIEEGQEKKGEENSAEMDRGSAEGH